MSARQKEKEKRGAEPGVSGLAGSRWQNCIVSPHWEGVMGVKATEVRGSVTKVLREDISRLRKDLSRRLMCAWCVQGTARPVRTGRVRQSERMGKEVREVIPARPRTGWWTPRLHWVNGEPEEGWYRWDDSRSEGSVWFPLLRIDCRSRGTVKRLLQ